MIFIHYDFSEGHEISYVEGLSRKDDFITCCLDFFNNEVKTDDVIVLCRNGDYVSRKELLSGDTFYINKHIRYEHNIHKMLVAGALKFKKGFFR
jgi:hypothetical protein